MEQINVAGMDAKPVVHHCEMLDALGVKAIHCQHHVGGIERMNEVRDDSIHLLSGVRRGDPHCFRFPRFMNDTKARRRCPRDTAIRLREIVSEFTKPLHNIEEANSFYASLNVLIFETMVPYAERAGIGYRIS
jgi:hypothetical protein